MDFSRFSAKSPTCNDHRQPHVGERLAHKGGVTTPCSGDLRYEHCDRGGQRVAFLVSDQFHSTIASKLAQVCPPQQARPWPKKLAGSNAWRGLVQAAEGLNCCRYGTTRCQAGELPHHHPHPLGGGRGPRPSQGRVRRQIHTVAEGDGPVSVLDKALRKA